MNQPERDVRTYVVTGALGYTGRSVVEKLLARAAGPGGEPVRVRTLTNSPNRPNPFGAQLEIYPLAFDQPAELERALHGADVLFNTYWVRFNHRAFTFEQAVRNTKALFDAARSAGVRRVVHVSILHAESSDDLAYYRGKHELERALRASSRSWAIVRPGVLFGRGDILINNIAWVLRRLPIFGVFGRGAYRLRPMHVDDMAELMIACGDRTENVTVDAVGPESFTYRELVEKIAQTIDVRRPIVSVPPRLGYFVGRLLGPLLGDVVITWEEVLGLMRGILDSSAPAAGATRLSDWVREHRDQIGRRYASELARRTERDMAYGEI